jgi:hypothetical protein
MDDEFLLDRITYEEIYEIALTNDDLKSLDALLLKEQVKEYIQKNVTYV